MAEIDEATTLEELALIISSALETAGIIATLSGGSAVSIYSENQYVSHDLDFVTSADSGMLRGVMAPLGFVPECIQAALRASPHRVACGVSSWAAWFWL